MFIDGFVLTIILRMSMGLMHGVTPICYAVLIEILPIKKAPLVIALTGAVWYLGYFIGPFIGAITYN